MNFNTIYTISLSFQSISIENSIRMVQRRGSNSNKELSISNTKTIVIKTIWRRSIESESEIAQSISYLSIWRPSASSFGIMRASVDEDSVRNVFPFNDKDIWVKFKPLLSNGYRGRLLSDRELSRITEPLHVATPWFVANSPKTKIGFGLFASRTAPPRGIPRSPLADACKTEPCALANEVSGNPGVVTVKLNENEAEELNLVQRNMYVYSAERYQGEIETDSHQWANICTIHIENPTFSASP